MRKLTYILRVLRSPKKIFQSLSYIINDEVYWDAYAQDWRNSARAKGLLYLGNEWKNEETFVALLKKHSTPNHTALEIGCGGGRITSKASKLFRHVYATDVSNEMLAQCRRSLPDTNVSYHKLDGFTLNEFADSSVDIVYSHDVFVHFSSLQVYPYLEEIKRVLRDGGLCIISFFSILLHFDLFKEMSLKFHAQRRFPPHMRVHFVTEEIIRTMTKDLDLELIETHTRDYLIVLIRKKPRGA